MAAFLQMKHEQRAEKEAARKEIDRKASVRSSLSVMSQADTQEAVVADSAVALNKDGDTSAECCICLAKPKVCLL